VALRNAEDLDKHKSNRKETITYAREAVQAAEDSRLITIRKLRAADEEQARDAQKKAEQQAIEADKNAEQQQEARTQAELAAQEQARQRAGGGRGAASSAAG